MHNGKISKFWDILVCPFVCMSVCVYRVGRYQKFAGVPLSAYCVYIVLGNLNFQNTLMLVLMGQFLDHDITLSPESEVALERCCASMDELSEELQDKCFAVRGPIQ